MLIGLIADTHIPRDAKALPPQVKDAFRSVDIILHAGDIYVSKVLDELEKIGVAIWTPRADHERAGIVFFRTPNHEALHARLKAAHIYCGTFLGGIRIDPNFYNTLEELDKFLAIVRSHVAENSK